MVNYQNSKVYSIRSRTGDEIYIGSTTRSIAKRFSEHKYAYTYWANGNKKKYCSSYKLFEKYDISDIYYELIIECPCENKEQLCREEGIYIRKYMKDGVCCNSDIAGRSKKEWVSDNKEYFIEYGKIYRKEHVDETQEYQQVYRDAHRDERCIYDVEYYQKNKDKIATKKKKYREAHKDEKKTNDKIYRDSHKEEIKELKKKYYIENKEELSKKRKKKYLDNSKIIKQKETCECGCLVRKTYIATHRKTEKHKKKLLK
jgi:hypothetical protein